MGILKSLTKAVVGVVIETPVSIVADAVTMGGYLTDKDKSYTSQALKKAMKNLEETTKSKS